MPGSSAEKRRKTQTEKLKSKKKRKEKRKRDSPVPVESGEHESGPLEDEETESGTEIPTDKKQKLLDAASVQKKRRGRPPGAKDAKKRVRRKASETQKRAALDAFLADSKMRSWRVMQLLYSYEIPPFVFCDRTAYASHRIPVWDPVSGPRQLFANWYAEVVARINAFNGDKSAGPATVKKGEFVYDHVLGMTDYALWTAYYRAYMGTVQEHNQAWEEAARTGGEDPDEIMDAFASIKRSSLAHEHPRSRLFERSSRAVLAAADTSVSQVKVTPSRATCYACNRRAARFEDCALQALKWAREEFEKTDSGDVAWSDLTCEGAFVLICKYEEQSERRDPFGDSRWHRARLSLIDICTEDS